jgi:hypothetical protein
VTEKVGQRNPVMRGAWEMHFLRGWPPRDPAVRSAVEQCTEHGPECAVHVTRITAPIRRIIEVDTDEVVLPG